MSRSRAIPVELLSREAFADFGDVIDTRGAESFPINNGRTERFHALATVDLLGEGAAGILSIFHGQPLDTPEITLMERHPLGSQAFMPLARQPFLAVVAPPGDFDESLIKAFLVQGHQGVNYRAGTWHAPLLPLLPDSDYLVVDRRGPGDNCDEVRLANPVRPIMPGETP